MSTTLLLDLGRSRRRLLLGLLGGLAALTVMYLAMFPSIQEQLEAFSADMPEAMRALIGDADLATPEGYLRSEVFALTAPLLVAALAIASGVALARSERDLTLTALFNAPLSRRGLASTYLALTWMTAAAGGFVVLATILLGAPMAGADVGWGPVLAATLHLILLAAAMGTVAFGAAVATGSPAVGLGAGWGLIVVSFVANGAAELVEGARWLADISPWGWYGAGAALTDGIDLVGLGLLLVVTVVAAAVGVARFQHRDLNI